MGVIQEAATICRELAVRWPDAYQQELGQSLRVVARLEGAETSAMYPRRKLGSDNGPLSGLPPTLGRSNALDDKDLQNRLIRARHPRAMAW